MTEANHPEKIRDPAPRREGPANRRMPTAEASRPTEGLLAPENRTVVRARARSRVPAKPEPEGDIDHTQAPQPGWSSGAE